MSDTRVYLDAPLDVGTRLELPDGPFRHLVQVLRLQAGARVIAFNGQGGEYEAVLEAVAKRTATLRIGAFHDVNRESPLQLTLVQGISKGDRMDWTIQKAVELGVSAIVPVVSERCNVNLDRERQDKKLEHWRGVVVSACEQSGRTRVPPVLPIRRLADWLGEPCAGTRLILDPQAPLAMGAVTLSGPAQLLVGPEGGFSAAELKAATQQACLGVRLGPRVLRTETAGVAALSILQATAGDLRAT